MNALTFATSRNGGIVLAAFLTLLLLSGCGLMKGIQGTLGDDDDPDVGVGDDVDNQSPGSDIGSENACGGSEELRFGGEIAEPGQPCGPCDRDTLRCDSADEEGNTLECSPGDTPCRGPTGLSATTDRVDQVILTWNHVEGSDEYIIYRDGEPLETVAADGYQESELIEYVDQSPALATPEAPALFEASLGAFVDRIELSWEFDADTMLLPGNSHSYDVIAVHGEVEEGASDPVSAQGNTVAEFVNTYQYRRQDSELWVEVSNPTTVDGRSEIFVTVDAGQGGGPNLPTVEAGDVVASDLEQGYEIALNLDGVQVDPSQTVYELRAITESGVPGEAAVAAGHLAVEFVTVQWERAAGEEPDDNDFQPVGQLQVEVASDGGVFTPVDPVEGKDTPPEVEAYTYRALLWADVHEDSSVVAGEDVGRRGDPSVITVSRDLTVRRVNPTGDEIWKEEPIHAPLFAVVDPEGGIYAMDDPMGSGNSVRKYNYSTGEEIWEFDGSGESLASIAVSSHGYVYITTINSSTVYRIDADDGEMVDSWTDLEGSELGAIIVDTDDHVYVGTHPSDDGEAKLWKLDFSDNSDVVQWTLDGVEARSMAIGHGNLYWGTEENTVHRIDLDEAPEAEVDVVELHSNWSLTVSRLATNPQGRLLAATFHRYGALPTQVEGFLYEIDFEGGSGAELVIPRIENSAINAVAFDPEGNIYYASSREEEVVKLDDQNTELWRFDGHATPNPDDTEYCDQGDGDCADVYDISVFPGLYGAFPDAWYQIQEQLQED